MQGRDHIILEAAGRVFSRYGVSKSTMADIATEAGVARQTVYNAYQNKDDLLRAVVRTMAHSTEAEVLAGWRMIERFDKKLDLFFELAPLAWFDSVQNTPDSAALIEGVHRVACVELEEAATRWREYFTQEISDHFDTENLDVSALADFIHSTALNAKIGVADRKELENRLAFLKASVMALLEPVAKSGT